MSQETKSFIYARTSTETQDPHVQVEACTQFAAENGYEVDEIFIDHGYTARDMNRPQLQAMIKSLVNNPNHVVITYHPDRIMKSHEEVFEWFITKRMKSLGDVEVIALKK